MFSTSLIRIAHKAVARVACAGAILALTAGPVLAAPTGGLHIDAASWDGAELTVDGGAVKPKQGGGPVEVFDADTDVSLGSPNLPNSGNWDLTTGTCAENVYATQDAVTTADFPVSGPGCGGGGNTPPVANNDSYSTASNTTLNISAPGVLGNDTDAENDPLTAVLNIGVSNGTLNLNSDGSFSYTPNPGFSGDDAFSYNADDGQDLSSSPGLVTITVTSSGNSPPVANDDSYSTTVDTALNIVAPGVLGNDTDADNDPLTAVLNNDVSNGTLALNSDGSFDYTPDIGFTGNDSFTYFANDGTAQSGALVTIAVNDIPPPQAFPDQTDFKIMMNYELGMHCTGFEFAYCCVLPAYNSILAQVIKPNQAAAQNGGDFPILLAGDPNEGLDALGRETVVRDHALDSNGNFRKYVLKYWHDAQSRNDGRGKVQNSTLISASEGNSLMSWNTRFDSVALNADGSLMTGDYNGSQGVMQGDGDTDDAADNYQNAVWNHLYFYDNLEGDNSTAGVSLEIDKIRLGVNGHVVYPEDCGPALHPIGPVTQNGDPDNPVVDNTCGGFSRGNVLTFSGDKGTVVYTQMKVLENLPVMLTSPDIWEALGLPLTTFEDTIDFFSDPGLVDEDSVRPFVVMNAQMYDYDPAASDGAGAATLDSAGNPVIGFGTAPIDIPNCERCHSNPADGNTIPNSDAEGGGMLTVVNSPNADPALYALVEQEYEYWNAYYDIVPVSQGGTDSDWYSRLKSAAISMLKGHDIQHGTSFAANYPGNDVQGELPQNTRLGHESVICQRCHADNVIAVVKSAECGAGNELGTEACTTGTLIAPITEAIHRNHAGVSTGGPIAFTDSLGRDGGCQGCHPAHRSNGDMDGYPITLAGGNLYVNGDNRGASGGCFVGRDVHSNPNKDQDGAETPEHLNAVGQYLADNVANDGMGIWCTNCHNQLGQEMWKAEDCNSLVHGDCVNNVRALPTLDAVATAVGTTEAQAMAWLDPTDTNPLGDFSRAIWAAFDADEPWTQDGGLATIEVDGNGPVLMFDGDGDPSVNVLSFCTTPDCVDKINSNKGDQSQWRYPEEGAVDGQSGFINTANSGVAVPMSAATDGRDHWLSPGEPHCADCHAAPYVEQSGNINPYPPFNYPAKASLMRYSKGHQNISCQGCHESIHGLYPVTPNIDTTTYAQAAALNADGSHGPLKCGTCHEVDRKGIPTWMSGVKYNGNRIRSYDDAVSWMHTFTDEVSPLEAGGVCENCHGDRSNKIKEDSGKWLRHSFVGRVGRQIQDKTEIAALGDVAGGSFVDADNLNGLTSTVCTACHTTQGGPSGDFVNLASCDNPTWKSHNLDGRLAEKVWEYVSVKQNGSTCGW